VLPLLVLTTILFGVIVGFKIGGVLGMVAGLVSTIVGIGLMIAAFSPAPLGATDDPQKKVIACSGAITVALLLFWGLCLLPMQLWNSIFGSSPTNAVRSESPALIYSPNTTGGPGVTSFSTGAPLFGNSPEEQQLAESLKAGLRMKHLHSGGSVDGADREFQDTLERADRAIRK
jgi:hypothetical protein